MKTVRIITHVMEDEVVLEEHAVTIPLYETSRGPNDNNSLPSILDPLEVARREEAMRNEEIAKEPIWLRRIRNKLRR